MSQFLKKNIEMSTDELFILHGVIALNCDTTKLSEYITKYSTYDKAKNTHTVELTMDQLSDIKNLFDQHTELKGSVYRFSARCNMIRDCLSADYEWEQKTEQIKNSYTNAVKKSFEEELDIIEKK